MTNSFFTVFDGNGGNPVVQVQIRTHGATYHTVSTPLPTPLRMGYTFNGWANSVTVPTATSTETLYAQWTVHTYKVQYNANRDAGDTLTATSDHTYDTAKALTANGFVKTGYTFAGWATNATLGGIVYTNGQSVVNLASVDKAIVDLYARWTANKYTVKYNGNDADGNPLPYYSEHTYDAPQALLNNGFVRNGYAFMGWTTNLSSVTTPSVTNNYANMEVVVNLTPMLNATNTLYANWNKLARVTLLSVGAEVSVYERMVKVGLRYDYDEKLPQPIRPGFEFNGWYTEVSGGEVRDDETIVPTNSVDHVLYAQWTDKSGKDGGEKGRWQTDSNRAKDWYGNGAYKTANPLEIGTPQELAQFAWLVNEGPDGTGWTFAGQTVLVTNDLMMSVSQTNFTDATAMAAFTNDLGVAQQRRYTTCEVSVSTNITTAYAYTVTTNIIDNVTTNTWWWFWLGYETIVTNTTTNVTCEVKSRETVTNITHTVTVTDNTLSMSSYYWTPAGTDTDHPFRGTFDGQGYTIQGITVNEVALRYVGLFGCIDEGEVRNVNLSDVGFVVAYKGEVSVGGVAGVNSSGIITNCSIRGKISVFSDNTSNVGGVVGENFGNGITIKDCINHARVEARSYSISYVGGITGFNQRQVSGINNEITRCLNYGAVFSFSCSDDSGNTSASNTSTGGVTGWNRSNCTVNRCSNYGHVSGAAAIGFAANIGGVVGVNNGFVRSSANYGAVTAFDDYDANYFAGGLVGSNETGGTIANCSNYGEVSASYYVGGLVGWNKSTIRNCINSGAVNASTTVSGKGASGGLVGCHAANVISHCYWKVTDKTDGFSNTVSGKIIGEDNAIVDDASVVSFDDAPGKLASDVTVTGYSATKSLLTNLNNWVSSESASANIAYQTWTVDAKGAVNGGYPYLAEPTLTVTFRKNGGAGSDQTVPQTYGARYALPTTDDPTREWHEFKGWFTEGGVQITTNVTVLQNYDHALYAQWTPTHTLKTPSVHVPHSWLMKRFPTEKNTPENWEDVAKKKYGIYEVWQSYVIGFADPTDERNRFLADIAVRDDKPIITWEPNRENDPAPDKRVYKLLARPSLDGTEQWEEVDRNNIPQNMRFFKVNVAVP